MLEYTFGHGCEHIKRGLFLATCVTNHSLIKIFECFITNAYFWFVICRIKHQQNGPQKSDISIFPAVLHVGRRQHNQVC